MVFFTLILTSALAVILAVKYQTSKNYKCLMKNCLTEEEEFVLKEIEKIFDNKFNIFVYENYTSNFKVPSTKIFYSPRRGVLHVFRDVETSELSELITKINNHLIKIPSLSEWMKKKYSIKGEETPPEWEFRAKLIIRDKINEAYMRKFGKTI